MPGILIHILLESLFSSSRNPYSHAPEYASSEHGIPHARRVRSEVVVGAAPARDKVRAIKALLDTFPTDTATEAQLAEARVSGEKL